MTHRFEEESQLLQGAIIPKNGFVTHGTSSGGSKEKSKRSPPKNDSPAIYKKGGLESPPQAKVIVLKDPGV